LKIKQKKNQTKPTESTEPQNQTVI